MRTSPRTRVSFALALALALAAALLGCTDGDDDEDQDGVDHAFAASQVAGALDAGGELSRLVVPLEASADLGLLGPDAARARKVQNAINAFRALVLNSSCVSVVTDNLTYLDVKFDRCRIALVFTLDGTLRASVAIETSGVTPVGIAVSIKPNLTLTSPVRTRFLAGEVALRQRITAFGAPVEFEGDLRFSPDGGPELAMSLDAAWQVNGDCVTLTSGAQLSSERLGELGPIALSAEGFKACRNQCPTAGSIELSYGRGALLAWTYTGASTVTVRAPRGKRVEVPLACGD
jgi:hypothetical protein